MRHPKRFDPETRQRLKGLRRRHAVGGSRSDLVQFDLIEFNELRPRAVGPKEVAQPGRRPDRGRLRRGDLAAQLNQSRVVPDVGMGQQNAVDRLARLAARTGQFVKEADLMLNSRGRLKQKKPPCLEISNPKARRRLQPAGLPGVDAARSCAAQMRQTTVLGSTEDDDLESRRRRVGRSAVGLLGLARKRKDREHDGNEEVHAMSLPETGPSPATPSVQIPAEHDRNITRSRLTCVTSAPVAQLDRAPLS